MQNNTGVIVLHAEIFFFFKQAIKRAINAKQGYRQTAGQGINLRASHLKIKVISIW